MAIIKLIVCTVLLAAGLFVFISAAVGVNRFHKPLNRIHAAALGDTMGLALVLLSLMIWKGFSFVSFKFFVVIIFFWLGSPVSGHMISRYEAETNDNLGEIEVKR